MILPYILVIITVSISACASDIMCIIEGCYSTNSIILISIKWLQGFFDAIIFILNPTVKEEMRKKFSNDKKQVVDLLL